MCSRKDLAKLYIEKNLETIDSVSFFKECNRFIKGNGYETGLRIAELEALCATIHSKTNLAKIYVKNHLTTDDEWIAQCDLFLKNRGHKTSLTPKESKSVMRSAYPRKELARWYIEKFCKEHKGGPYEYMDECNEFIKSKGYKTKLSYEEFRDVGCTTTTTEKNTGTIKITNDILSSALSSLQIFDPTVPPNTPPNTPPTGTPEPVSLSVSPPTKVEQENANVVNVEAEKEIKIVAEPVGLLQKLLDDARIVECDEIVNTILKYRDMGSRLFEWLNECKFNKQSSFANAVENKNDELLYYIPEANTYFLVPTVDKDAFCVDLLSSCGDVEIIRLILYNEKRNFTLLFDGDSKKITSKLTKFLKNKHPDMVVNNGRIIAGKMVTLRKSNRLFRKFQAILPKTSDSIREVVVDKAGILREVVAHAPTKVESKQTDIQILEQGVYVVGTNEKAKQNLYKIGKHTGSQAKLLNRYKTSLINPYIYHFHPTSNYSQVEKDLLLALDEFRVENQDGRKTEWVSLELSKILEALFKVTQQPILRAEKLNFVNYV